MPHYNASAVYHNQSAKAKSIHFQFSILTFIREHYPRRNLETLGIGKKHGPNEHSIYSQIIINLCCCVFYMICTRICIAIINNKIINDFFM